MLALVYAAVGTILLLAGRRVFWLVVGSAGFVYAFPLTVALLPDAAAEVQWGVGLVGGLIGAVVALAAEWLALLALGAQLGFTLGWALAPLLGSGPTYDYGTALAGLVLGGMLAYWFRPVFVVLLSALLGARLLTHDLPADWPNALVQAVTFALFALGVWFQIRGLRRPASPSSASTATTPTPAAA